MFSSEIQTILLATPAITTILTGGIFTPDQLGYKGLSRHNTVCTSAFDANGDLRPTAVIVASGDKPDNKLRDSDNKFASVKEIVQIYLFRNGIGGFTTLKTASDAIYNVLHEKRLTNAVNICYMGDVENQFSKELNDACTIISNYEVYGLKGS